MLDQETKCPPTSVSKSLYFIAIIPPTGIRDDVEVFRKIMADQYLSKHARKSPPHITLIPPFYWIDARYKQLKLNLEQWFLAKQPFEIQLENFNFFKQKVLYIEVLPNPDLDQLQMELKEYLQQKCGISLNDRVFHPHLTIAFKDLSIGQFNNAWNYFQKVHFSARFSINNIAVLRYADQKWHEIEILPIDHP